MPHFNFFHHSEVFNSSFTLKSIFLLFYKSVVNIASVLECNGMPLKQMREPSWAISFMCGSFSSASLSFYASLSSCVFLRIHSNRVLLKPLLTTVGLTGFTFLSLDKRYKVTSKKCLGPEMQKKFLGPRMNSITHF